MKKPKKPKEMWKGIEKMKEALPKCCLLVTMLLGFHIVHAQKNVTLSGYIKDAKTGEELIGATVFIPDKQDGAVTNGYGFYSYSLQPGTYKVVYSFTGYQSMDTTITLKQNTSLNMHLKPEAKEMEEVVVTEDQPGENVESLKMSKEEMDIEMVKKMPDLFGEADILKAVKTKPGVVSVGEGTSSFHVRGGDNDQNLVLIDEAPVYSPSHVFGLFSVFNSDILKSSDLYKGGIPSRYGGRLSSVLDISSIDGNNQQWGGAASIGLLSSKAMIEGPIKKDESSVVVAGRRSYFDLLANLAAKANPNQSQAEAIPYFYDLNAKVNFKPNNKNRFFISGYFGRDVLNLQDDLKFDWGNRTLTARWNHLFSDRLFSNTTFIASKFDYNFDLSANTIGYNWKANLREYRLKQDYVYYIGDQHELQFGWEANRKIFSPSNIEFKDETGNDLKQDPLYAMNYAIYGSHKYDITPKLSLRYGLRTNLFQRMGPGTIKKYANDPKTGRPDNDNIRVVDSTQYDSWETIKSFLNLQPRLSLRYKLNNKNSVKLSYNRMTQNMHLMSNTTVPIPFNTWRPSSPHLDPQLADQVAAGFYRNFANNKYEFSAEAYYKKMDNKTSFADNASLLINPDMPTEFRQGQGTSYGAEVQLKKNRGDFSGYINYTYSKATLEIPDVNNGKTFPASYDRRHVLNAVLSYQFNQSWSVSSRFKYATGRPTTVPTGRYTYQSLSVPLVSEKNGYRMEDFHRLDLSVTYEPKANQQRSWHSEWKLGVYNVYNRYNPFTIWTEPVPGEKGSAEAPTKRRIRQLSLFGALPSISYKLEF